MLIFFEILPKEKQTWTFSARMIVAEVQELIHLGGGEGGSKEKDRITE